MSKLANEWLDERGFPPGLQVYATPTTQEVKGLRAGLIAYWRDYGYCEGTGPNPYIWSCWYCGKANEDAGLTCEGCNAPRKQ